VGIKQRTITEYFCDVCDAMCDDHAPYKMITHQGDRDLAASYMYVLFKHYDPMSNDEQFIICNPCRKDYLKKYLEELEK
jgi:hypothetical protein